MNLQSAVAILICILAAAPLAAQDLEGRISPGNTIFITDRQGHEISGRLTALSPDTLRVLTSGGERDVLRRDIGRVEKPDSLWDGAAIGAAIFTFGFAGGAGASCSPHCAGAVTLSALAGAALGGYIGALIDKAIPGRRLVYGVSPDSAFAISPTDPITESRDLWMKLKAGDRIHILETSGLETEGRFAASSASSISIVDGGLRQEIPAQRVFQVTRRGSHLGLGTLAGVTLGVATSAAGACRDGTGRRDYAACTISGALVGAIVGRLIPRQIVVYRSSDGTAQPSTFVPIVTPIFTSTTKAVSLTLLLPQRATSTSTSTRAHPIFVSGRFGGYGSWSDPTDGRSFGAGGSVDVFLTEHWAVDVDVWMPGNASGRLFIPSSMFTPVQTGTTITYGAVEVGEFRDAIAAVSALRRFGGTGVHPYLLVGLAQAWTSARTSTEKWTETSKGGPQVGIGLVIPATERLDVVPEFRMILGPGYFVARPTVGVTYRIR